MGQKSSLVRGAVSKAKFSPSSQGGGGSIPGAGTITYEKAVAEGTIGRYTRGGSPERTSREEKQAIEFERKPTVQYGGRKATVESRVERTGVPEIVVTGPPKGRKSELIYRQETSETPTVLTEDPGRGVVEEYSGEIISKKTITRVRDMTLDEATKEGLRTEWYRVHEKAPSYRVKTKYTGYTDIFGKYVKPMTREEAIRTNQLAAWERAQVLIRKSYQAAGIAGKYKPPSDFTTITVTRKVMDEGPRPTAYEKTRDWVKEAYEKNEALMKIVDDRDAPRIDVLKQDITKIAGKGMIVLGGVKKTVGKVLSFEADLKQYETQEYKESKRGQRAAKLDELLGSAKHLASSIPYRISGPEKFEAWKAGKSDWISDPHLGKAFLVGDKRFPPETSPWPDILEQRRFETMRAVEKKLKAFGSWGTEKAEWTGSTIGRGFGVLSSPIVSIETRFLAGRELQQKRFREDPGKYRKAARRTEFLEAIGGKIGKGPGSFFYTPELVRAGSEYLLTKPSPTEVIIAAGGLGVMVATSFKQDPLGFGLETLGAYGAFKAIGAGYKGVKGAVKKWRGPPTREQLAGATWKMPTVEADWPGYEGVVWTTKRGKLKVIRAEPTVYLNVPKGTTRVEGVVVPPIYTQELGGVVDYRGIIGVKYAPFKSKALQWLKKDYYKDVTGKPAFLSEMIYPFKPTGTAVDLFKPYAGRYVTATWKGAKPEQLEYALGIAKADPTGKGIFDYTRTFVPKGEAFTEGQFRSMLGVRPGKHLTLIPEEHAVQSVIGSDVFSEFYAGKGVKIGSFDFPEQGWFATPKVERSLYTPGVEFKPRWWRETPAVSKSKSLFIGDPIEKIINGVPHVYVPTYPIGFETSGRLWFETAAQTKSRLISGASLTGRKTSKSLSQMFKELQVSPVESVVVKEAASVAVHADIMSKVLKNLGGKPLSSVVKPSRLGGAVRRGATIVSEPIESVIFRERGRDFDSISTQVFGGKLKTDRGKVFPGLEQSQLAKQGRVQELLLTKKKSQEKLTKTLAKSAVLSKLFVGESLKSRFVYKSGLKFDNALTFDMKLATKTKTDTRLKQKQALKLRQKVASIVAITPVVPLDIPPPVIKPIPPPPFGFERRGKGRKRKKRKKGVRLFEKRHPIPTGAELARKLAGDTKNILRRLQ